MGRGRRPNTVEVEELWPSEESSVDVDDAVDPRGASRRRTARTAIGVVGTLALGAAGFAIFGPSSASTDESAASTVPTTSTVAPPTTRPRPVRTTPSDDAPDLRLVIADPPAGYEVAHANVADTGPLERQPYTPMLFVGADSTRATGPWLLIEADGGEGWWRFTRPPRQVTINDTPGFTGETWIGDETTGFRIDNQLLWVTGQGLPIGTTQAVAAALNVRDTGLDVAAADLPTGLRPSSLTVNPWFNASGPSASISYDSPNGWIDATATPSDSGHDRLDEIAWLIDDVRYTTVNGARAVAGTITDRIGGSTTVVAWQVDGRDVVLRGDGPTVDEMLDVAQRVRLSTSPTWRESDWEAARELTLAAQESTGQSTPSASDMVEIAGSAEPPYPWAVKLTRREDTFAWVISKTSTESWGRAPLGELPLLFASGDPVSEGDTPTFDVSALAVVEAVMEGTVLRVSAGTASVEVPLRAIEGSPELVGYLAAATVLPWTDGEYRAELIGPDGTVLDAAGSESGS